MEHIGGEEVYERVKMSAGARCLIIFEGLDEIAIERQRSDEVLLGVIKECTLLELAIILITSRPHACEMVKADRTVEIVGFGHSEIKEFAEKSFTDVHSVHEFLLQLNEYPHLYSLCYIPMNLVMIVDIFQVNKKKLPSTVTELYQLFVVMTLQRQIKKENARKPLSLATAEAVETLHRMLKGIPKETVATVFLLSRMAFCGFFNWYSSHEDEEIDFIRRDPKIIFTVDDLIQCGIEATADWDGYGLLKVTHTHQLPTDTITYNFAHLTIQEFMCAVYISTLPDHEQQRLLSEHFDDYPNVFIFFCGLAGLVSHASSEFICKMLQNNNSVSKAVAAIKCVYEGGQFSAPQSAIPFELELNHTTLLPFDCLCLSYALSCGYPVVQLSMVSCNIGNTEAQMLGKYCTSKNTSCYVLQELMLHGNNLTVIGVGHVMKTLVKCESMVDIHVLYNVYLYIKLKSHPSVCVSVRLSC